MLELALLVLLPGLDQPCSTLLREVHGVAWCALEAVVGNLPTSNHAHDEPIRERAQFLGEVQR